MIINRKEYKLSPRKTGDVLRLSEYSETLKFDKEFTAGNLTNNAEIFSITINDSLRATYKNFSFWQKLLNLRYRKFLKNNNIYLYKHLTLNELGIYFAEVQELEGSKKKVAAESESAEKLQEA